MSLLDKARSFNKEGGNFSEEEMEVSVAWIKGEITNAQITAAVGKNTHYKLAKWLKAAYKAKKF